MASPNQVKQYLAYWFQLGKRLVVNNGQEVIQLKTVIQGDRYSQEFEECWQRLMTNRQEAYLEGTVQTIEELLSPTWEISPCARCDMPVPILSLGLRSFPCPCYDLPTWPNLDLPRPRSPVDSQAQLQYIRNRLLKTNPQSSDSRMKLPQAKSQHDLEQ